MPRQGSPSPARRPQLEQRQSLSQSVSKGSPTAGHLSKSHKGSSTRLHKTHAVGHGRHTHGRVPSYGKGLHKLSKLGPGETGDGAGHTRHHTRSASQTPTGSPTDRDVKRNSSNVSLPRTGSKVSIEKNVSNVSLARNASGTKLGNQSKLEKAQLKHGLRKKGTASFEVGDEDEDEDEEEEGDWEDNSSQSPFTTRSNSARPKSPLSRDPPSPDEPPERSPRILPASPPDSPPNKPSVFADHVNGNAPQKGIGSRYSQPPNADDVTHWLLNRSTHNVEPKMSTVSASITPNGSASPVFSNGHDSTSFNKEPSMPTNGISRFLPGTGSTSGSATPGSVSHLQSTLAHLNHTNHTERHRPTSPLNTDLTINRVPDRRTTSATSLSRPALNTPSIASASTSPPKSPTESTQSSQRKKKLKKLPLVSPYESARGIDPNAGKSVTQLKIDLQRMATLRDTPSSQHPLLQHGSVIGIQNLSAGGDEVKARYAREYHRAQAEFRNAVRFHPELVSGALNKRGMKEHLDKLKATELKKREGGKAKGKQKTTPGSSGDTVVNRGRVRFEVGRSAGDEEGSEGERENEEGVKGLLERMWAQTEHSDGADE